jgi:hypothetical protein
LAEGKGYRLLNERGEIEADNPPLIPLTLAAHEWVLGTHDPVTVRVWLRRTTFFIYLLFAAAVYLTLRRYLPIAYAFLPCSVYLAFIPM